jgi:putative transposase
MTKRKMTKRKLPAAVYGPDGNLLVKRQPNPDVTALDHGPGHVTANAYLTQSGVRFMSMTFHDPDVTSALLNAAPRKHAKAFSPRRVKVIIPDPGDLGSILVWNGRGQPRPHFVTMPNRDSKLAGVSLRLWKQAREFAEQQDLNLGSDAARSMALDALRKHWERLADRPPVRAGSRRPCPTAPVDLGLDEDDDRMT